MARCCWLRTPSARSRLRSALRAGSRPRSPLRREPTALASPGGAPTALASPCGGGVIGNLFSRRRPGPATVAEALSGWGIALQGGESVTVFCLGEVDGVTGFLALTNRRVIFVAGTGERAGVRREHPLDEVGAVRPFRRRLRRLLRVTCAGAETVIGAPDRRTLDELEQALGGG